jgi:hypothetical protein
MCALSGLLIPEKFGIEVLDIEAVVNLGKWIHLSRVIIIK